MKPKFNFADNIEQADRCALMRGTGMTYEEMRRPKIAVFNTLNGMNPGHIHQGELGDAVYKSIYENGGYPVHMNGTNLCDGFAVGPFALPSRDLLVNDIEVMCMAHQLDGAVLIGTCDKIVPAMLMAAGRMDIPCIILTGGYMKTSVLDGKDVDFIDIAPTRSKYFEGEISKEKFDELIDVACPGGGSCGMMGTANSMALMTEVIGMSLPGNATTAARSPKMLELAAQCGKRIMELVEEGITPRQIITNESITNALYVCQAIGGSANTIIHIPGAATEAELSLNCSEIYAKASRETPLLVGIRPNGEYCMKDFEEAGGLGALMNQMRDKLNLDCMQINGKTLGENIAGKEVLRPEVIHSWDNPIRHDGGLLLVKGTLAPEGAFIKRSAVPECLMKHTGPAHCFNSRDEAIQALRDGKIKAGEVCIVRYIGVKAGPDTAYHFAGALAGSDIGMTCATVTDGRLSGAVYGAAFQYCTPEAAAMGPLTVVQDGDIIDYDIDEERIDLLVPQEEIERRLREFKMTRPKKKGWLGIYERCVSSVMKGAVLVEPACGREDEKENK